ncbi:putative polyketide synthase [Nemania sp. FL0916]|nr:putative polyketide synthase [Nemania sp. FL0916]
MDQDTSAKPAVLLFGSLALSFDDDAFRRLCKAMMATATKSWLPEALLNLANDCEVALASVPSLSSPHGHRQLLDIRDAAVTGRYLHTTGRLSSTAIIPLAVAVQLAQYGEFLERSGLTHEEYVLRRQQETVGLCTGLLAAFAVAASRTQAELAKNGTAAIRLGMLVGLAIDTHDSLNPSKSISVGWSSRQAYDSLIRTLKDISGAYTSVSYDENRATITLPVSSLPLAQSKIKALGLTVSEINLFGRFHSHDNGVTLEHLLEFCNKHDDYQLPDLSQLVMPVHFNTERGEEHILQGGVHALALRAILIDLPKWYEILRTSLGEKEERLLLSFGSERCVPPSVLRQVGARLIHLADSSATDTSSKVHPGEKAYPERPWRESDIAVVGMACKLPGAEDVAEFWDLLASAKPQHQEIGTGHPRFDFADTPTRSADDPGMRRRWFANLMNSVDQFDHRFFKRSPRESASMDPAQRLILQVAYQAVEQSGYFNAPSPREDADNVGVFLGTTGNDYQANAASQAANAFTTTGNLQAFLAGKVSHQFGWTGPAMVVDTACSGSLVAIHQACNALVSGECSAALAGGAHVMTQPDWFRNLAGGQFLSQTGQCKPFDAAADGYCRGEGVGAVFLKRMDRAMADGDSILGVIAATAVQQNINCTPIFVPNAPTLTKLFRTVTNNAGVKPSQISVVEAHGTGTPVGDPAEYGSIREVLGGANRSPGAPLILGSVKGLIGHLEGTSGVVALIKLLMMLHVGFVPPQASFNAINPAIAARPEDDMKINTALKPWDVPFRVALINNYGASGSNASAVLAQPPVLRALKLNTVSEGSKYPFWLSGHDHDSLLRRAKALRSYISRIRGRHSLANLSYNLARQNNRALDYRVMLNTASLDDLHEKLGALSTSEAYQAGEKAVVLCFGGQVSTFVGLDQQLYRSMALLRKHLDCVDVVVRKFGLGSIFPSIFQRIPIEDTVLLQISLFAMQYACARSWLDVGIKPAALVGHSFGELTALCVSQVLSLEDTVRMIAARATLIRDAWGSDKGAMMAVSDANLSDVQDLIHETNNKHHDSPASIACYNGPRSFTIAGSTAAINALSETLTRSSLAGAKTKRLNVSNAFHCALADGLIDDLKKSTLGLTFHEAVIPLERSTPDDAPSGKFGPDFVAKHMRNPVYFHDALQRIVTKHRRSSLVFLEAGSNSTITHMASRALADSGLKNAHFQPLNITNCEDSWNKLVDTTLGLWRAGLAIQFWGHHSLQAQASPDLVPMLLPPYQFDQNARHWIDLKVPPKYAAPDGQLTAESTLAATPAKDPREEELVIFSGFHTEGTKRIARFRVNTSNPEFEQLLAGHMTLQTAPICPATVQIGLVVNGLQSIRPAYKQDACVPQFRDIQYQSPMCANSTIDTWIEAIEEISDGAGAGTWTFEVFSTDRKSTPNTGVKALYTTGRVLFMGANDASLQRELVYLPRLFGYDRVSKLLARADADEVLANRNIYRMFAEIVDYGDEYRGIHRLVAHGNEAAGVVVPTSRKENDRSTEDAGAKFDPHLSDTFCQVAGIWANFFTARESSDAYLANGIGQWIRAPAVNKTPDKLHVFSTTHRSSDKALLSDVFVFDAADGALLEVILGIAYYKVPKKVMGKLLLRFSDQRWISPNALTPSMPGPVENPKPAVPTTTMTSALPEIVAPRPTAKPVKVVASEPELDDDVLERVKLIIADLSGLEPHEIKADSELAELGIDSLVGMELINELEAAFGVKLPQSEIQVVVDMPGLMKCLLETLGLDFGASQSEDSGISTPNHDSQDTGRTTPVISHTPEIKESKISPVFNSAVLNAFDEIKALTDERIAAVGQTRYVKDALPLQEELTIALTIEAFDERGAGIRDARPGQKLVRISHGPEHQKLVSYLYRMLDTLAQVITFDGENGITRTAMPVPTRPSREIYEELTTLFPDQQPADRLTYYAGTNLARVLAGQTDGVKLIFGSPEGRELAAGFYGDWPLNRATYAGLNDFLERLADQLSGAAGGNAQITRETPLRILEMGAGTGGTTKRLLPLLARLGLPVEYTFTDLSPSLMAQARKAWAKEYPFMRFAVHDIEKSPTPELVGTQHLVIASNAVHATRSLQHSTRCIRSMLRPDGFLCLVEMTRPMYWVDIVFGLFEGWWMMEDGREHIIAHEERWAADLQASGYGHVDWIDGASAESKIWKLIIASADPKSRLERDPVHLDAPIFLETRTELNQSRERLIVDYVEELSADWDIPLLTSNSRPQVSSNTDSNTCVLITGGTGGLGSHLIASSLRRSDLTRVICLNRRNRHQEAYQRQKQSLLEKGTGIDPSEIDNIMRRVEVIETDMSKPNLGLTEEAYTHLVSNVTHIVHNAWLMHSKWPLKRFEPQLRIMANMICLARDISMQRGSTKPVTFEFVSSIATVGYHPLHTGKPAVPEARVPIESVLSTGYGDAKYMCERLLDATLHRYPARFHATTVRLGQIAGSSLNGYWNRTEHVSFLVKSSQTIGAFPDLPGSLGWTPVNDIADTLVDILLQPDDISLHPIYHIENPVRQPWGEMISMLSEALDVPAVIPFAEWTRRVREWPTVEDNNADGRNPAFLLVDFLENHFVRMSCGGLHMSTAKAREHSPTLAQVGPVSRDIIESFMKYWKDVGFLKHV